MISGENTASFGAALLSQTLIEFRLQHPQVSVEVIFTEPPLDLIEAGFDIAFYFTDNPPEGYVGHQLRTLHCKPIAHRSYLADKPNVSTPENLGDLEHILYKSRDLVLDKWTFTHKQTQYQPPLFGVYNWERYVDTESVRLVNVMPTY